MIVLAIDTCEVRGSVAVLSDAAILHVVAHTSGKEYSSWLLPAVDLALKSSESTLEKVDVFAVASGPGSFTGVRIALTTVKAWNEVFQKPIVAMSRLEVVAAQAERESRYVAAFIDAQRSQIFGALYDRAGSRLTLIEQEMVSSPEVFLAWLDQRVAGNSVAWSSTDPDAVANPPAWQGRLAKGEIIQPVPSILAPLIGQMAFQRALLGEVQDALSVDANYVRRSYVEGFQKGPAMCPEPDRQVRVKRFKVRPLQLGEGKAVSDICRQCPQAAQWSEDSYEEAHALGRTVLVAETESQICGFLVAQIVGDEAEILNIAVEPAHRRTGVGGALLSAAILAAQARKVRSIYLEVRESNSLAVCFYAQHGFEQSGQRRGYYSDPTENAVVMKKLTG